MVEKKKGNSPLKLPYKYGHVWAAQWPTSRKLKIKFDFVYMIMTDTYFDSAHIMTLVSKCRNVSKYLNIYFRTVKCFPQSGLSKGIDNKTIRRLGFWRFHPLSTCFLFTSTFSISKPNSSKLKYFYLYVFPKNIF